MLGQEGLSAAATGNGPGDDKDRTDPDTWLVFDTSVTDLTPTARLWVEFCALRIAFSQSRSGARL